MNVVHVNMRVEENVEKKHGRSLPKFKMNLSITKQTNVFLKLQINSRVSKTNDIICYSHEFSRKRIHFRLAGDKSVENYGYSWRFDHKLPFSFFVLLDEKQKGKFFV